MASTFTFGFEYDKVNDVDPSSSDDLGMDVREEPAMEKPSEPQLEPPDLHSLQDMLASLPSTIFYSDLAIKPPDGRPTIRLPRRELFDIRAQLMAEDPDVETNGETLISRSAIPGLSAYDDIIPGVYEGGFKTWECSIDLAVYLSGRGDEFGGAVGLGGLHVVELGSGTALPTLTILDLLLANSSAPSTSCPIHLTLADYNPSVLYLSAIPNILLTHTLRMGNHSSTTAGPPASDHSDLEITPSVLSNFTSDICHRNIHISAISGAWSSNFADLVVSQVSHPNTLSIAAPAQTLILASETIYSPTSLLPFTTTLFTLLQGAQARGRPARALIAAKRVYFGVGGGVDEFLGLVEARGGVGKVVWQSDGDGVGRVILEVKTA